MINCEPYIRRRAVRHLERGLPLAAGTETLILQDSSDLRAIEMK